MSAPRVDSGSLAHAMTASQPKPRKLATGLLVLVLLFGLSLPGLTHYFEQGFYLSLATRMVIIAIAASGLNLLMGYGGLVSMGHAMFIGIGVYAVGITSAHGLYSGWQQLAMALGLTTVVAFFTGLISLRTRGIAFIMISLAFGQMLYFLAISLEPYGGDDGLPISHRSQFDWLPSLDQPVVLYYLSLVVLGLVLWLIHRLVQGRFGYVLRGLHVNELRMRSAGFSRLRFQLCAYILSALLCTVAGFLLANLTKFASPSYLSWQSSGDLILMVVLGGLGTIVGPLVGAVAFLMLEEWLSGLTQHWMAVLGLCIFAVALWSRRGIWGWFTPVSNKS